MGDSAPVALFVYNRPDHTALTLEYLKKNVGAQNTKLFIFSDGPSELRPAHHEGIKKVREIIRRVEGFKEIELVERTENWGLAKSIISGVTQIVKQHGRVIVLEDDLQTSPHFLSFMNDALRIYESHKQVLHIQGYNYPVKAKLSEAFFTRDPGSWGWATWSDRWALFEPDSTKLLKAIKDRYCFDFDGAYPFYKMLKMQAEGKVNSWAIRWYATAFIHDKLALWPGESLVLNNGFDDSGVHCEETNAFTGPLRMTAISQFPSEVVESPEGRAAIINFFKSIRVPIRKRIWSRLIRLFSPGRQGKFWDKPKRASKSSL